MILRLGARRFRLGFKKKRRLFIVIINHRIFVLKKIERRGFRQTLGKQFLEQAKAKGRFILGVGFLTICSAILLDF